MLNGFCVVCNAPITYFPSRPRKYCSRSCATTARNRTSMNPSYHRDISGKKNPMYGKGLKGKANPMFGKRKELAPRWKGGKKIRRDGYSFVIAPDDHPHPSYVKKSGLRYILEHRLVMERHLGRYLDPSEVVHHIDENPLNNDVANLRLFATQREHMLTAHPDQVQKRRKATGPQKPHSRIS